MTPFNNNPAGDIEQLPPPIIHNKRHDADYRAVLIIGIVLIVAPWVYTLEQWVSLTWWDAGDLRAISMSFPIIIFMVAPAWLIGGFVFLIRSDSRRQAMWVVCTGVLAIVSLVSAMRTAKSMRGPVFAELAERSKPLVAAIKKYEKATGTPPARLDALVPEYLPAIPATGIPIYPDYRYSLKSWVEPNRWELSIPCGFGPLNWDQFLYLPEQNYPEKGYGGTLERIGEWAYVHE